MSFVVAVVSSWASVCQSAPPAIGELISKFDNQVAAQQFSKTVMFASRETQSREITRLNNILLDLKVENDILRDHAKYHDSREPGQCEYEHVREFPVSMMDVVPAHVQAKYIRASVIIDHLGFVTDPELLAYDRALLSEILPELNKYGITDLNGNY